MKPKELIDKAKLIDGRCNARPTQRGGRGQTQRPMIEHWLPREFALVSYVQLLKTYIASAHRGLINTLMRVMPRYALRRIYG